MATAVRRAGCDPPVIVLKLPVHGMATSFGLCNDYSSAQLAQTLMHSGLSNRRKPAPHAWSRLHKHVHARPLRPITSR